MYDFFNIYNVIYHVWSIISEITISSSLLNFEIWYWKTTMKVCKIKKGHIYNNLLVKGQQLKQQ